MLKAKHNKPSLHISEDEYFELVKLCSSQSAELTAGSWLLFFMLKRMEAFDDRASIDPEFLKTSQVQRLLSLLVKHGLITCNWQQDSRYLSPVIQGDSSLFDEQGFSSSTTLH
ncbi:hypothetical protein COB55_05415 [Candidatus Wolfebacteria bacterium]|nr:MAG: hypothetical protein COB55_05415 [Candidatus Wolfebacteria bacterium]